MATALSELAVATLKQLEVEKANQDLQREFHAEQERLQIVRTLTSHLAMERDEGELLKRILALATSNHDSIRAIIWLLREEQLWPAIVEKTSVQQPRSPTSGLLGKALAASQAITEVPTDPSERTTLEPELSSARGVAILPLQARTKTLGVLEVWSEQEPFDPLTHKRLETLAFLATTVLENERRRRRALEGERIRRDVEIAGRIQQTLLLGTPPLDLRRATASALTTPSLQIGGDFYDFYAYDQTLDVLIGDVMGKGVTAALVGAAAKIHFLRAVNYLFAANPGRLPEPREILSVVSAELFHQLSRIECFVTLCYARFDLAREQVEFIDCGHPSTIHAHGRSGGYSLLKGENMPVGFSKGEVYRQIAVPFSSDDVFFFYSDGVTEARNPAGEYYGVERLGELIAKYSRLSPRELVKKVQQDVQAFTKSKIMVDDLTCVAVKIADILATVASTQATLEIASAPTELPRVRAFLREMCERQIDPASVASDLSELELAATEAVSAIMTHAYQGRRDGRIRFEADLFLKRFVIRIYYRGQQVDPDMTGTIHSDSSTGAFLNIRRRVDVMKCSLGKLGESCVYLEKWLGGRPPKGA
jgi:serine phosphatase RsbU (regulator of sigma subunit)